MTNNKITVASSPHIKSNLRVNKLMRDVLIALLPAVGFGIYFNGTRGLLLLLTTVLSTVLSEGIFRKIVKKSSTLNDLSAVVTGVILGLILPVNIPLWIAAVAGIFAIFLVKEIYGGLGQNFMNPAATGKIFVTIAYGSVIVTSSASSTVFKDAFIGQSSVNLGEASILAILIGGLYLLAKGVIRLRVPFTIILVNLMFSHFVLGDIKILGLNAGIYLVAFFLANDYASSSITNQGKWIYALLLALLTAFLIGEANNPDGAYYAVLIGNVFAPLIDSFFKGKVSKEKGGK
ncbi:MAG: RnfABCDGE type electron transport complex subunit D [Clostridium sp.]|nr:RnfABCDGE type electron transport complex subunit D [Clostridium sp.]